MTAAARDIGRAHDGGRRMRHDGPYDAVLCDLDNVVRFYDVTHLSALERAAGLPEGTTEDIAYAPEVDLPLLLGRITLEEWVEAVALGLAPRVGTAKGRELGRALAEAPSGRTPRSWRCCGRSGPAYH